MENRIFVAAEILFRFNIIKLNFVTIDFIRIILDKKVNIIEMNDSDLHQSNIIVEMKKRNIDIELYRHFLSVFGSVISIFGIIGN